LMQWQAHGIASYRPEDRRNILQKEAWKLLPPSHGLADSGFSCVIASGGKMADAMGFCVEWAERAKQH
jgi:hypothetical protein